MIDAELITRKLALIAGDLPELKVLAATARTMYSESTRDQLVAERLLERIIGRMIDTNYHIITELGHPPPRDYYDSFIQLGTFGVLTEDFAKRVAACAGLRNRIVREYNDLDPAKVHEALQSAVDDFPAYLRAINRLIETTSAG